MSERNRVRSQETIRRWVYVMGLLILLTGCHSQRQSGEPTLLERISRMGSNVAAPKPGELAERGLAEITVECEKQSYENAKKGLVVSQTGLHEDVFTLRDRVSLGAIGYGLDEALRLEVLLRAEAKAAGHPAEQANCIQKFAEHLESVSDPLVEADERLKELDASAFEDSTKAAREQAEKQLLGTGKRAEPKEPTPQNY